MPERNGTRSSSRICCALRRIVAGPSSVLTVAPPSPGKCLIVGATSPARQPRTDSATCWPAAPNSVAKARPASAAPGTLATSATGASDTLIPVARSAFAAASASSRTVPAAAWAACERSGGAQGRIRMSPPSWSTQISGGWVGSDPRRNWPVSRLAWAGSVRLSRNRIAPAARPSPSTSRT